MPPLAGRDLSNSGNRLMKDEPPPKDWALGHDKGPCQSCPSPSACARSPRANNSCPSGRTALSSPLCLLGSHVCPPWKPKATGMTTRPSHAAGIQKHSRAAPLSAADELEQDALRTTPRSLPPAMASRVTRACEAGRAADIINTEAQRKSLMLACAARPSTDTCKSGTAQPLGLVS